MDRDTRDVVLILIAQFGDSIEEVFDSLCDIGNEFSHMLDIEIEELILSTVAFYMTYIPDDVTYYFRNSPYTRR